MDDTLRSMLELLARHSQEHELIWQQHYNSSSKTDRLRAAQHKCDAEMLDRISEILRVGNDLIMSLGEPHQCLGGSECYIVGREEMDDLASLFHGE